MIRFFNKNLFFVFFIFLASIIAIMPKISDGLYLYGHDSGFHRLIIEGYKTAFSSFVFDNDILPVIGYNLGYGTPLFYPTTPHAITAFISLFKIPIPLAMDIMHWLNFFLSGIMMFILANKIYKNKLCALLCSYIYIYSISLLRNLCKGGVFRGIFICSYSNFFIICILFNS